MPTNAQLAEKLTRLADATADPGASAAYLSAAKRISSLVSSDKLPTLPRSKHSHRCKTCNAAVYCYKTQCVKPQRVDVCGWCPRTK